MFTTFIILIIGWALITILFTVWMTIAGRHISQLSASLYARTKDWQYVDRRLSELEQKYSETAQLVSHHNDDIESLEQFVKELGYEYVDETINNVGWKKVEKEPEAKRK